MTGVGANLAAALVAAQASFPAVKKEAQSHHGKYADLGAMITAVHEALAANGLAVLQPVTEPREGAIGVTTIIVHTSGEIFEAGPLVMPAGKDAQSSGSVITYARRYALGAVLNLALEADDDGEAATKEANTPPARTRRTYKTADNKDTHVFGGAYEADLRPTYTAEQKVLVDSMKAIGDPSTRKQIMAAFVGKFGKPETVGEDRMDDAFAWVTLQCQEAG